MATNLGDGETNVSPNTEGALKKEYNEEQPPEVNEQPLMIVRDALNEQPLMIADLMMMDTMGTEIAYVHNDISTAKLLAKRYFVPTSTCSDPKELLSKGYKIDRIVPGSKGWLILLRYDGEKTEIEIAVVREKNWFDDFLHIKPLLSKGYKIDRIVPGSEGWLMILRR